jgi:uncharacterized protein with von Willebrand factor type A (vWA) domain
MEPETPQVLEAAVAFGRLLRRSGVGASTDRVSEFARALEELDVTRREHVYWAGRVTLCSRPEELEPYDLAFKAFWEEEWGQNRPPRKQRSRVEAAALDSVQPPKKPAEEDPEGEEAIKVRYSPVDVLKKKDFARYTPEEFEELWRLLAGMKLTGSPRRSRRHEPARRGSEDPRRTLRAAMRTGGEPVRRRFRRAGVRPRRVVLLSDVSGSMESYSRALLRFLHAGVISSGPLEAFALGTRLTRLTRELASHDPDRALEEASGAVEDWSGGTRLGDTMKEFVDRWGQRGMARGAIIVILSDGWDTGEVGVLAEQMSRLRRLSHRIIWVNPLKASPGYQPLAKGMATALPFVDVFLPGHDLESLEELAHAVSGATTERGGTK